MTSLDHPPLSSALAPMPDAVDPAALDRAQALLDGGEPRPDSARQAEVEALGQSIVGMLKTIYDPEIPVDIFELGLVYKIDIEDDNRVTLEMTLTSPSCPVAETLPPEVEQKVASVEGVAGCTVAIVWDPPWHPGLMSEEAKLELNMF